MTGADERQGQFLVLSGDTLGVLRASGLPDREIIAHVLSAGGKPARVDVAIDLFASSITPADMATAYDQKRLKTPARRGIRTYGINDPDDTFYLGSGQSERFFRAYDKGAQLGIKDGEAWLRLELECKRLRARGLAHVLASADNTRQVINRAIGDYVQMPDNDEFSQALSDQSGSLPEQGRKLPNTLRWLIEQVDPAIARYETEHRSDLHLRPTVFRGGCSAYTVVITLRTRIPHRDAILVRTFTTQGQRRCRGPRSGPYYSFRGLRLIRCAAAYRHT